MNRSQSFAPTAPLPAGHDRQQCDCEACRIFRRAAGIDPPAKEGPKQEMSAFAAAYLSHRRRQDERDAEIRRQGESLSSRLKRASFLDTLSSIGAAIDRRQN